MFAAEVLGQPGQRLRQLGPLQIGVDRGRREELELERFEVGVAVLAQPLGARLLQRLRQAEDVPGDGEQLRREGIAPLQQDVDLLELAFHLLNDLKGADAFGSGELGQIHA